MNERFFRTFLQMVLHPHVAVGDTGGMSGQETVQIVSVTCSLDKRAHEVTDAELAGGARHRNGFYQALCGRMIAAAAMVMPDGAPCQLCVTIREQAQRSRRRLGRRHRLLG